MIIRLLDIFFLNFQAALESPLFQINQKESIRLNLIDLLQDPTIDNNHPN